ncbi:MAG: DUF2283 domain-containing protein [Methanothrix sp.]|jgi:uncharacterized protein YuzE|nr:DUF2283 domain-containing protein [Methanothrix sp.]
MQISYDPKYDVMYLKFSEGNIADTIEVETNVLIDYGERGEIMGIEIINASTLMKANPLHELIIKIQEEAET